MHDRVETTVISHQLCNCGSTLLRIGDITAQDHWCAACSCDISRSFLGRFWSTHADANNRTR
jgi:hypothetical protein